MNARIKKAWDAVTTVLVTLMVILAVFLMGSRILGYQVFNVVSGSMEPAYSAGDLLYVKTIDPDAIQIGDPITFVLNEDLVVATHRVIGIDTANRHFYTKGDANDTADAAPVHFNNVIGVPRFSIPLLGYVSDYIQNPPGMYVAIGFCIVLLAVVFLPDAFRRKTVKDPKKEEEESSNEQK